jgi:hypothetical protein
MLKLAKRLQSSSISFWPQHKSYLLSLILMF